MIMATIFPKVQALTTLAATLLLSACSPPSQTGAATVTIPPAIPGPDRPEPTCPGVRALFLVESDVYDSRPPNYGGFDWRMAVVSKDGEPPKMVRARARVLGDRPEKMAPGPIISIVPHGAWLPDRGGRCLAPLVVSEAPPRVRRIGPRKFLTDVASFGTIGRLRVTPVRPEGWRLSETRLRLLEMREGSLLRAIGIEDGDELVSVNGVTPDSQDVVADAFRRFIRAEHLSFLIERDGARIRIELHIER